MLLVRTQPNFEGWLVGLSVIAGEQASWSPTNPRMVTHHPKDGHPPFKIYQKEVYYRLEI